MNSQEDELLLHIAAGTDLPTALAALPREETEQRPAGYAGILWILAVGAFIAWWRWG